MNRRQFLGSGVVVPGLLPAQAEPELTSLFDGRTLAGWSIQEAPESAFYVENGDIVGFVTSDYPAWLRSDKQYENFDLRLEFFVKGWTDGGVLIHAPEHGRATWAGMNIKIFHQQETEPRSNSMGSIFPLIPPLRVNVKNRGEWNGMRVLMDWPRLRVWVNDEPVQDLDAGSSPELRYRLRRGYIGLQTLSYPIRLRNLRIRELPGKEKWETLYEAPEDLSSKWFFTGKPNARAAGEVLWADGSGYIATKEKYRDFELHLYVRGERRHNGGVLFRTDGKGSAGRHYEIQIHDVEDAHYPTGSLYHYQRSVYPRVEPEKWYLMQVVAQGKNCLVRVNGDTVLEYDRLENLEEGNIELQAHQPGRWLEYKHIRVKRLQEGDYWPRANASVRE